MTLESTPPGAGHRELRAEHFLPVLQDALAHHGRFRFPLRGNSMKPTLPADSEIEIVPLHGDPRLGQLVVFVVDNALVAHRVVAQTGNTLIAQGDNRLSADPPIAREQVLGLVAAAQVGGRQVWPRRGEAVRAAVWLVRSCALRAAGRVRRYVRR